MPPKKTGTAAPKKASTAAHGSYHVMIKDAIVALKERSGSSRQAIKKYIKANNTLGDISDTAFNSHLNRALAAGEKNGDFLRPKGASGPVKLAKKEAKPAAAKKESKPASEKKTTTKKATTKAAPKKAAATKKTTTAKAAPKKTAAAKPKANASKPRKTATAAPAVVDKPTVLTKTKSGRVAKTTKATAPKKTATKKAPAKKAATKKSTPKKAEAAA